MEAWTIPVAEGPRPASVPSSSPVVQPAAPAAEPNLTDWWAQIRLDEDDPLQQVKEAAKVRTRIRARLADTTDDWREELEAFTSEGAKPLITAEDIRNIRQNGWIPQGIAMPCPEELSLGYDTAWDIGKRGCVAYKLTGDFDIRIGPNKMRFFIMDGTNDEAFLTYYTKPDALIERGEISERKGTIRLSDMRDGFWNYTKKKVRITRTDSPGGLRVLESFPDRFFDAMLVCIREAEIQYRLRALKESRVALRQQSLWKSYLLRRRQKDVRIGRNSSRSSLTVAAQAHNIGPTRHTVTHFPNEDELTLEQKQHERQRCASEMAAPLTRGSRERSVPSSLGTLGARPSFFESPSFEDNYGDDESRRTSTISSGMADISNYRGATAGQRIIITQPND